MFLCTDMFNLLIFAVTSKKGQRGKRREGLSEGYRLLIMKCTCYFMHLMWKQQTCCFIKVPSKYDSSTKQQKKKKERKEKRILALCKNGLQCLKGWEVSSRWVVLFFHVLAFYFYLLLQSSDWLIQFIFLKKSLQTTFSAAYMKKVRMKMFLWKVCCGNRRRADCRQLRRTLRAHDNTFVSWKLKVLVERTRKMGEIWSAGSQDVGR